LWYNIATMKTLAFYALFVAVIHVAATSAPLPRQAADPKAPKRATVNDNPNGQKPPAASLAPTGTTGIPGQKKAPSEEPFANGKDSKEAKAIRIVSSPEKDRWDKTTVIAGVVLVVVGFAGTLAAVWTLKAINRQNTHLRRSVIFARKNAIAAKKSADAIINSERAWLLVEMRLGKIDEANGKVESSGAVIPDEGKGVWVTVHFWATNHGKSPAWIREWRAAFSSFLFNNIPKAPDIHGISPIARGGPLPPGVAGKKWNWQGRASGDWPSGNWIIYGSIRYLDIFGKCRESVFAYSLIQQIDGTYSLERIPIAGWDTDRECGQQT